MEKSKVYFTDMRCEAGVSLLDKLDRLICEAGIERIDFERKFVAVKMHFGEPGNLAFLRPNFAKTVADRVKALGGLPFLTDCNTLYVGRRRHALEHLEAAQENGFSPASTGCQIIIGDGLKGTDDLEVPVEGGEYCKTAKIGRAVMDADVLVSLNHFKGHELTGFGGALKNIGMGSGSRAGKMQMHSEGQPVISQKRCKACGLCFRFCAQNAIYYGEDKKANIDPGKCVGCGRCIGVCNFTAISNKTSADNDTLNCRIAEYAKAAMGGRPGFHVSIVNQVSPYCDCHSENDAAVVPDIGMFASFDPVAIDRACIDAVNAAPVISGILPEGQRGAGDHFTAIHPVTDWRSQLSHAEKLGLGSSEYRLVPVR
ncbi:MAG: DUF362 domain-containing protein [Clostridiales Family XIII bacterium]|jgi:uncharacterized Fe-S center protein|nr:DUF362 domain-containing protein [Clostridiales Family XIII bacterium]